MSKKKISMFIFILISFLVTLSISNTKTEAKVKQLKPKITIKQSGKKLEVNKKIKLKVHVIRSGKAKLKYKWSSSNKKIAVVSKKGIVTGKKTGTVKITVKVRGNAKVKASCKLKVIPKKTKKKITVPISSETLKIEEPKSTLNPNAVFINHRGYNSVAPENTLSAFRLSKKYGFSYVETDVQFTSDKVPVCLHDSTVNRTSNGEGNITELSYEQVKSFDFGSWKSKDYAGEKIPSLEEFLLLCKDLELHPYIEIKQSEIYTQSHIDTLIQLVNKHHMEKEVIWISYNNIYLEWIKNQIPSARLGLLVTEFTQDTITSVQQLKTSSNNVFIDAQYSLLKDEHIQMCINSKIPLEVWTINASTAFTTIHPYISGITTDQLLPSNNK